MCCTGGSSAVNGVTNQSKSWLALKHGFVNLVVHRTKVFPESEVLHEPFFGCNFAIFDVLSDVSDQLHRRWTSPTELHWSLEELLLLGRFAAFWKPTA